MWMWALLIAGWVVLLAADARVTAISDGVWSDGTRARCLRSGQALAALGGRGGTRSA